MMPAASSSGCATRANGEGLPRRVLVALFTNDAFTQRADDFLRRERPVSTVERLRQGGVRIGGRAARPNGRTERRRRSKRIRDARRVNRAGSPIDSDVLARHHSGEWLPAPPRPVAANAGCDQHRNRRAHPLRAAHVRPQNGRSCDDAARFCRRGVTAGSTTSLQGRPPIFRTADIADDPRAPPKRTPTARCRQESSVLPSFELAICRHERRYGRKAERVVTRRQFQPGWLSRACAVDRPHRGQDEG